MTDNRTTEKLRELLDERGIKWRSWLEGVTIVGDWCFVEYENEKLAATCEPALTPGQAVAATLGNDDDYERKMDALLCRLTNGKWSKSRAYDLDFMEQCINEEFEMLYAKDLADAELGNCTLTAEQVETAINNHCQFTVGCVVDAQAIADELNACAERTCRIVEYDEAPIPVCSECGAVQPDDYAVYFCWSCGAKVRDE